MRWVHEMSDMCTRPSMPSSTPTKMPKSVMLRTLPLMIGAERVLVLEQRPRVRLELLHAEAMRLAFGSMSSTTASTVSPTFEDLATGA